MGQREAGRLCPGGSVRAAFDSSAVELGDRRVDHRAGRARMVQRSVRDTYPTQRDTYPTSGRRRGVDRTSPQ